MGATPELIVLLIRHDAAALTVIDISPEMCATARSFVAEEWRCVEWLVGDWCEPLTRLRGGLDCVCCDGGTLFLEWPTAEVEGFREMVSSLHVALFLGTQRGDLSMDPEPAAHRLRQAREILQRRYQERHVRWCRA